MRPDDAASDFFVEKLASSHARHGVVLGELTAVFRALAGGGAVDDETRRQLEDGARYLSRALPRHYADEEATFFPRVLAAIPGAAPHVAQLIREHAEHTAAHARVIAAAYDVLDCWLDQLRARWGDARHPPRPEDGARAIVASAAAIQQRVDAQGEG